MIKLIKLTFTCATSVYSRDVLKILVIYRKYKDKERQSSFDSVNVLKQNGTIDWTEKSFKNYEMTFLGSDRKCLPRCSEYSIFESVLS